MNIPKNDKTLITANAFLDLIISATGEDTKDGLWARITKETVAATDRIHDVVAKVFDCDEMDDIRKTRQLIADINAVVDRFEKGGAEND